MHINQLFEALRNIFQRSFLRIAQTHMYILKQIFIQIANAFVHYCFFIFHKSRWMHQRTFRNEHRPIWIIDLKEKIFAKVYQSTTTSSFFGLRVFFNCNSKSINSCIWFERVFAWIRWNYEHSGISNLANELQASQQPRERCHHLRHREMIATKVLWRVLEKHTHSTIYDSTSF